MRGLGAGSKTLYRVSSWLVPMMPLAIALVSWCNGLKAGESWLVEKQFVLSIIQFIQGISFELYVILWLMFLWSVYYKRRGDPWLVEKLQFILDRYQAGAFNLEACPEDMPKDHNRVTLFRRQKIFRIRHWSSRSRLWPWGKHSPFADFLVPVLRSGHISKKTTVAFVISDESDKVEGIAGHAWACREAICLTKLPAMMEGAKVREKKLYAEQTCCDVEMIDTYIQKGRAMPRSIVAIPVEKNGNIWGVIVLDSRYPEGVKGAAVENYRLTVALIGHLLERAS